MVNRKRLLKAEELQLVQLPLNVRVVTRKDDNQLIVARVSGPRELRGLIRRLEFAEVVSGIDLSDVMPSLRQYATARIRGPKLDETDDPRVVVVDGKEYRDPHRIELTVEVPEDTKLHIMDGRARGRYEVGDIDQALHVSGRAGEVTAGRTGGLVGFARGDMRVTVDEVRGNVNVTVGGLPIGSPRVTVRSGYAKDVAATVRDGEFEFGGVADTAHVETTAGVARLDRVTRRLWKSELLPGQITVASPPDSDPGRLGDPQTGPRSGPDGDSAAQTPSPAGSAPERPASEEVIGRISPERPAPNAPSEAPDDPSTPHQDPRGATSSVLDALQDGTDRVHGRLPDLHQGPCVSSADDPTALDQPPPPSPPGPGGDL
jgi:hypothetical protein